MNTASHRPTVALVGRPNVGKSTLLNRLAKKRVSLAHETPGLTRDRIYATGYIHDHEINVIDTAGLEPSSDLPIYQDMVRQTQIAIEQADLILFMCDATQGPHPDECRIAGILRAAKKPVVVVVNKSETKKSTENVMDFYELGFDQVMPISAAYGNNMAEFFDLLTAELSLSSQFLKVQEVEEEGIRLAVVGKPNAGKSSFLNKLLGQERHLVSEMPGTTMDAIDSKVEYGDVVYHIMDTAGVRRKRSIYEDIEKMAVCASWGALDQAQVALLMLDATTPITEQDQKIAGFIEEKNKAVIIVMNKWDLAQKAGVKIETVKDDLARKLPFFSFAPVCYVSAKTGRNVFSVLEVASRVHAEYQKRVKTAQVNKMLERAQLSHPPPIVKGRRIKFYFGTQITSAPPTFILTTNDKDNIHFSYQRFLNNQLRSAFGFEGSPIRVFFRGKSSSGEEKR